MKKLTLVLLCIVMALSLSACGMKEKIGEKIGEKVVEGALEKATGEKLDIDLDEDSATIKGADGEELSFGNKKWPKGGAVDVIPAFNGGTIISAAKSDTTCLIMLEEVEESEFEDYVEELKAKGFVNNVTEHSGELGLGYHANSDEKTKVSVMYYPDQKSMHIGVEIVTDDTGENY